MMTTDDRRLKADDRLRLGWVVSISVTIAGLVACTVPNPNYRRPGGDAGTDPSGDAISCKANEALRCDDKNLVRCNAAGTGEISEVCSILCNAAELRCADVAPSNGLAKFLDIAAEQNDIDLGDVATINTDTGDVVVDKKRVAVLSDTAVQPSAPTVRVFIVRSLTAKDVVVTGENAIAVVSHSDVAIKGLFSVSANFSVSGPGAFNDSNCRGKDPKPFDVKASGAGGGGGFGSRGGSGGSARSGRYFSEGGAGGMVTGSVSLIPLRGGCDSGASHLSLGYSPGGGGGAIQFVSRTRIVVSGSVAANGAGFEAGGSGGGILLEAPSIEISGNVVANGGAAAGPGLGTGENGRLDDRPAKGAPLQTLSPFYGTSGNGAAGDTDATNGGSFEDIIDESTFRYAGGGGGGVGRIRINSRPGGMHVTGLFSPRPIPGPLLTR